jgi:high-affinity iron transporter
VLATLAPAAAASTPEPWRAYQQLDAALFEAQLGVTLGDRAQSQRALVRAGTAVDQLSRGLKPLAPAQAAQLQQTFSALEDAVASGSDARTSTATARTQTAALAGSFAAAVKMTRTGNATAAQRWLLVREFKGVTRYSHPDAAATVAVRSLADGVLSRARAAQAVQLDLLDTYEALLRAALDDTAATAAGDPAQTAQSAATADGYWAIVRPAYRAQRGAAAARAVGRRLDDLVDAAAAGRLRVVGSLTDRVRYDLLAFRAAPLPKAEQARRAGQLTRFLGLIPIEYARGVAGGTVTVPIEIQEAIIFRDGAATAFGDLQSYLAGSDPESTRSVQQALDRLQTVLADADHRTGVADPQTVKDIAAGALDRLNEIYPDEWKGSNTQADFDVIATLLQKVRASVAAGDYRRAESSRLEAYATFELGPEQHLRGLAPALFQRVEGLFWYGDGGHDGLARLVSRNASTADTNATLTALDQALDESAEAIGEGASRPTVILNTAIITFREGLEAVLILAALMASMVGVNRRFRRPLLAGALLSLVATALTWFVAENVLNSLSRYGERVEAVVSLVAIGVLLLILNWFYHRVYWQENLQNLHRRKKSLLAGAGISIATAQVLGFVLLGFTSVYREGFETTLFVQALTLEAGTFTVLQGIALGLAATVAVGVLVMALERKLPHKKMLMATGLMITWVLVALVGQTVQILEKVGWVPVTPVDGLQLPYWTGLWLGIYPTWQGLISQGAAAAFVVGSYVLAEYLQRRKRARIIERSRLTNPATQQPAARVAAPERILSGSAVE